ncbi:WbqC family protein [Streptomyces sp. NPDC003996]
MIRRTLGQPGGICAIHQPNLFPRLSTLAKLYAADQWIVLDDVQFARRDYQHRARLAVLADPAWQQWLTLPTHLPHGRQTLIKDARLADLHRSRRTVELLVRQYYRRSPHWPALDGVLDAVLARFEETDRLADIAETSMRATLDALGWPGQVMHSSGLPARRGRSERLADLAHATGSTHYLCGPGGLRYLTAEPFDAHSIPILPFHVPVGDSDLWGWAAKVSSLWALGEIGRKALEEQLSTQRDAVIQKPFTAAAQTVRGTISSQEK